VVVAVEILEAPEEPVVAQVVELVTEPMLLVVLELLVKETMAPMHLVYKTQAEAEAVRVVLAQLVEHQVQVKQIQFQELALHILLAVKAVEEEIIQQQVQPTEVKVEMVEKIPLSLAAQG
jgi:hypothetical protein